MINLDTLDNDTLHKFQTPGENHPGIAHYANCRIGYNIYLDSAKGDTSDNTVRAYAQVCDEIYASLPTDLKW